MTIFDLVKATELTAYWEEMSKDRAPYLGEELFPNQKKLGLKLEYIKGASGLPVVLKPSAFDAEAVPLPRLNFEKMAAEMPFFKSSMYIDEVMRQELNIVMDTGNQGYIDTVLNRIFNDEMRLIEAAAARREQMRMMALTTGAISVSANGQKYDYDYGIPSAHKVNAGATWATPTTDIPENIRTWQDKIEDDTGVRPTRAICSRKTWGYIRKNQNIIKSIFVLSNGEVNSLSDARLNQYFMDEFGLEVVVYSKRYMSDANKAAAYVPDDTFVMFPEGTLGNTWFGTTPEESDLLGGRAANVSITDMGVAVTTMQEVDPVQVETKVTMICLPSFEKADEILIADVSQ